MENKLKWNYFIMFLWQMLQTNRFWNYNFDKLRYRYDSVSESKTIATLLAHMSHHAPVKFHAVSEKQQQKKTKTNKKKTTTKKKKEKKNKTKKKTRMYLSQNNASQLNNYPHLLDKKLSTCHRKRFCLRNSVKYLQHSTFS